MRSLAERLKIDVRPKRADILAIHVIKGVSPCAAGGYSVEAVLNMPEAEGLKQVAELLKTVGEVKLVEDFGVAMVGSKRANAKVFAGGQISAVGDTTKEASEFFDKVARAVLRANMCTKCGICVRACPTGAIKLGGQITVDESKCDLCGKCAESCVVAHYFDKLAGEVSTKERPHESKGRR
jgi:phosphoadenosine phosphosulfate reductase